MNQNSNFPISLAKRFGSIEHSIFSEMNQLVRKFNAINLGQGAPNFHGPEKILNEICIQMHLCHNQYAPAGGEFAFREQLAGFIHKQTGMHYDPDTEITVTCGASEALFCILNAFLGPGDRVVLLEPAFDLYAQAIANSGAEIIPVPLQPPKMLSKDHPQDWNLDWEAFEAAQKRGFKCIIINTPHNPTGKVFTAEEIRLIGEAALKNNALIVADEVYENLVYEHSHPYISVASFPEFQNNTVRISSAAKTFGFTGLKIGWASAPKHLTNGLRLVHQGTVFSVNPALQLGLAECFKDEPWLNAYLLEQKNQYLDKRNILKSILEKHRFIVSPCYGTFFLCANFKNFSDITDSVSFSKKFIETQRIGTIPLAPFYKHTPENFPWVRFAFCKTNETLHAAEKNLCHPAA